MTRILCAIAIPLWVASLITAFIAIGLACIVADGSGISDELNEELTEY